MIKENITVSQSKKKMVSENSSEQKMPQYHSLAPVSEITDPRYKSYDEMLKYAFDDEKKTGIENIAVSGPFGSGKSSIVRSFESKNNLSFNYITIADFQHDGEKVKMNELEEKIINQLIQQIPDKVLRYTKYRTKRKPSKVFNSLVWASITYLILAYIFKDSIENWSSLKILQSFLTIILPIASLAFLIGASVIKLGMYNRIKQLSIHQLTVDTSDEADTSSYFDRNLDEILYILAESDINTIVFEDLDRFSDVDISVFTQLRELCLLANKRRESMSKSKHFHGFWQNENVSTVKSIRFVYLINDDTFTSSDRTKFFDFIVPVIPVVDGSNSYAILKKYLEDDNGLDDFFLRNLSLYLNDMRLVKNVANEYVIYLRQLSESGINLNRNRLLAMIAYKNICLADFAGLKRGEGYIYGIFNIWKRDTINKKTNEIKQQIEKVSDQIQKGNKEVAENQKDLNILRQYHSINNYEERLKALDFKHDIPELKNKKSQLARKLHEIESYHVYQLLEDGDTFPSFDEICQLEESKDSVEYNRNLQVGHRSEFSENTLGLIEFLIRNDWIDEYLYKDYCNYFREKELSRKDKEFLLGINAKADPDYERELESPELIVRYLSPQRYTQKEVMNADLICYVCGHLNDVENAVNFNQCLENFVYMAQKQPIDELQSFMEVYYRHCGIQLYKYKILVEQIVSRYPEVLVKFIKSDDSEENRPFICTFVIYSVNALEEDKLKELNENEYLTQYLSEKLKITETAGTDIDGLGNKFCSLNVRFKSFEKQIEPLSLRQLIYKSNCYVLSLENMQFALDSFYSDKKSKNERITNRMLTEICSDEEQPLYAYVCTEIADVIQTLAEDNNLKFSDDDETVYWLLNKGLANLDNADDVASTYVNAMNTQVDDISRVNSNSYKTMLLQKDHVLEAQENVFSYVCEVGLDKYIVKMMNRHPEFIYTTAEKDDKRKTLFWKRCCCSESLSVEVFASIAEQLGTPITFAECESQNESNIAILIKNKLLKMDRQSLLGIRLLNKELIPAFAGAVTVK